MVALPDSGVKRHETQPQRPHPPRQPIGRVTARLTAHAATSWRALGVLLLTLPLLLLPHDAAAHDASEARQVLVQIEPAGVDVLITWELSGGIEAARYRALIDITRTGRIDPGLDQVLAASTLLPRVLRGVVLLQNRIPWQGELVHFIARDGPGRGANAPIVVAVHLHAPWPSAGSEELRWEVLAAPEHPGLWVALQLSPYLEVRHTTLPPGQTTFPYFGPALIHDQDAASVLVTCPAPCQAARAEAPP